MKTIGLSENSISDVLHVLAGILMIGNIEFVSTGGAQVQDRSGKYESLKLRFSCCYLQWHRNVQLHSFFMISGLQF